jgi:hypothetical protein
VITLLKNYSYDNSYNYTKSFVSKASQSSFFNSFSQIIVNPYGEDEEQGYIKEGDSFCVGYEYDYLVSQGVNYVIFNNGYKDIYAFITKKEYVNEETTRLNYEVDVMQTFMFDFTINKSFIERKKCKPEEIPLLTDYDEGVEIGEHYIESAVDVMTKEGHYYAMFGGFRDYYINNNVMTETPFYNTDRPVTTIDGIIYPFMLIALDTEIGIQSFYKYLVDLPNLLGIIRFPACISMVTTLDLPIVKMVNGNIERSLISCPKVVTSITASSIEGQSISIPKEVITDFFPYTYYVLTDGETDSLIMHPQYLLDTLTIYGKVALSHSPVERYFPNYYKGETEGTVYNITNSSVMMLPTGTNGGIETLLSSANQINQQKISAVSNMLTSTVMGGAMAIGGGPTGLIMGGVMASTAIANGFNSIQENIARNKDIELTPSSIKSYGTPSTRDTFYTDRVRVLKYTIEDKYKTRLLNYIDRYGNKYNNYDIIDIKNYSGFIKFASPDIDGKIDNMYMNKITEILERGIYFE